MSEETEPNHGSESQKGGGFRNSILSSPGFKSIDLLGDAGRSAYEKVMEQVNEFGKVPDAIARSMTMPDIDLADTPQQRTARQTASMADALDVMRGHMAALVDATKINVDLSREARDDNREAQRATRRMTVASLWVSIGSGVAALGSLVVAVIALFVAH